MQPFGFLEVGGQQVSQKTAYGLERHRLFAFRVVDPAVEQGRQSGTDAAGNIDRIACHGVSCRVKADHECVIALPISIYSRWLGPSRAMRRIASMRRSIRPAELWTTARCLPWQGSEAWHNRPAMPGIAGRCRA